MSSSSAFLSRAGSGEWINGRFERAVDIIQSLPKSGPIQTSYDDKLLLYSVYKQATEGNLTTPRPGMLDVLGRAKWDAWNKRKNVSEFEAKRIYVDGLIKILKGFSDRSLAVAHVRELENFTLNPRRAFGSQGQSINSARLAQSSSTDSDSDSEASEDDRYQEASSSRPSQQRVPLSNSQQSKRNQSSQSYPSTSSQPPIHRQQSNRRDQITPKRRELEPSGSVAPSLPGYGPPRTTVDNLRDRNYSSSRSDRSESYSEQSDHRSEQGRITPVQRLNSNSNPITNLAGKKKSLEEVERRVTGSIVSSRAEGSKAPIDAALDRIQLSLTTLHQRLNTLETKTTSPTLNPAEENGKLVKTVTSANPIKNLLQLLFFHSKIFKENSSLKTKVVTLLTELMKATVKGVGRITLDLLVGIFMVGVFRRMFIGRSKEGEGMISLVKKILS